MMAGPRGLQLEPFGDFARRQNSPGEVAIAAQGGIARHEDRIRNFGEQVPEVLVAGVGCGDAARWWFDDRRERPDGCEIAGNLVRSIPMQFGELRPPEGRRVLLKERFRRQKS